MGRLRRARREHAGLSGHDHHDLARAVRARPRTGAGGRGRRSSHGAVRGLSRPARALREARLDRDDRGRRVARLRHVLRALLEPSRRSTGGCCFRRSSSTTGAYAVEKASRSFIRTHIFPGGCLPSLEVIARCMRTAHRHANRRPQGSDAALRRDAATLARQLRGRDREPGAISATTSAFGGCGGCTSPTARPASPSGASASRKCRWPSLCGAGTPAL